MDRYDEILQRIDNAISLGEEPSLGNITADEYQELITLNSMINNDIELIRMYNGVEVHPIDLLRHNYVNGYYPLLEKFGLVNFLPNMLV